MLLKQEKRWNILKFNFYNVVKEVFMKIKVPKELQIDIMRFFMKTSVPRILKNGSTTI